MRQSTNAKKKSSESAHSQMTTCETSARISSAHHWKPGESGPSEQKNWESGNTWGTRPQATGNRQQVTGKIQKQLQQLLTTEDTKEHRGRRRNRLQTTGR